MNPSFHLSIGVLSLNESIDFYTDVLKAKVLHRDPSGYVNIEFQGCQITLKENEHTAAELPDFHFGANMTLQEFNVLSENILREARELVEMEPEIWDAGTPMERKKMYLKCPSGYLIELKGYK